jgi:hypothetical protein
MNMSNLHDLIVNDRHINYISSELADANNMDMSNPIIQNKIKRTVTDVLEHTYNIFDKSKIHDVNEAINKVVNVTMKRLKLEPRQRNVAVPVNMRMPPQHSANTRFNNNDSIESRSNNYMKEYREFNLSTKPQDVPDWLRSQTTNPKRLMEEQQKNNMPKEIFNKTSTRKPNQIFNDSEANPSQDIEDYSGNLNFSYFNETPEITSAFDDAFYNTGVDPSSMNDVISDSLDSRLKKVENERNAIKVPEQKIDNIEELFKNDNEFKKYIGVVNKNPIIRNEEQNENKMMHQSNKNQQLMAQQNRMHPGVVNTAAQYSQHNQQQHQQQQFEQYEQQLLMKFSTKEKQYQEQLQIMHNKMGKYEEYLKILMQKYNEIREERDLIKKSSMERFKNTNSVAMDAMEEKKAELLRISQGIQEKINRLESLQQNTEDNNEE